MKLMMLLAPALLLLSTGTAFARSPAHPGPAITIESNNDVGFRLMQQALKTDKAAGNKLVSPISAHFALSMALNGSNGKTRDQFLSALGYAPKADVSFINSENAATLQLLEKKPISDSEKKALRADEALPPVLSVQNSIWSTNGATNGHKYTYRPEYVKSLAESYGVAAPTSLDFKAKASADVINKWTSDATNKMIPKIIDAKALNQLTWVLLNTTYIDAQWETQFNKPYDGEFTSLEGKKSKTQMMSQTTTTRYADTAEYQVMELSIAKSEIKAYVVLPKNPASFASIQQSATGIWSTATWASIFADLKTGQTRLEMPKFTFEYGVEMKEDQAITKGMGFNFLFKNNADFSAMDGQGSDPSKVGIIKQNTKIEWTESGVKAAAATLVGGMMRSAMPRYEMQMTVDRPFYIAIYDEPTKAFLFLGQVVQPK